MRRLGKDGRRRLILENSEQLFEANLGGWQQRDDGSREAEILKSVVSKDKNLSGPCDLISKGDQL